VLEGLRDGQPLTIFAFDPITSGFEKSIGFPVLVANAVSSTLARAAGPSVRPGQAVSIPTSADGQPGIVIRPDGQREPLHALGPNAQYDQTDQVGRYAVQDSAAQRTIRTFSVSLLSSIESDINPRQLTILPNQSIDVENIQRVISEWWWPLAAVSLVLLACEWLVFAGRG
jgi:hypothetical protein